MATPRSPEEWEIVRRSVCMLAPGQPALKREEALAALDELQRLSTRDREVRRLVQRLQQRLEEP